MDSHPHISRGSLALDISLGQYRMRLRGFVHGQYRMRMRGFVNEWIKVENLAHSHANLRRVLTVVFKNRALEASCRIVLVALANSNRNASTVARYKALMQPVWNC